MENKLVSDVWALLEKDVGGSSATPDQMTAKIDRCLESFLANKAAGFDPALLAAFRQRLIDRVMGLGPLEELLRDPSISEIMVNGRNGIFIEKDGDIQKSAVAYASEVELRSAVERMVIKAGRRVDLASPLCDARLPDGSRINVVLPPVSLDGPLLTVRRFKPITRTMADLLALNFLTEQQADSLISAVHGRKNIVISGNSGAGKTTLLNVLCAQLPETERILTLEDAAELNIRHSHVVRLETRRKNAEGRGEVTMSDLVVNALRMRPDRLIIGECRGAEVIPMLQAMNTGHTGSMSTIHANSAKDALSRLESLVLLHAPEWPPAIVREQIRAGVHVIVFIRRANKERKVIEILET